MVKETTNFQSPSIVLAQVKWYLLLLFFAGGAVSSLHTRVACFLFGPSNEAEKATNVSFFFQECRCP
jgi:hypothetical protein